MTESFNDFIQEVREKNNIVDVVRSYIDVQQKGNTYWAKCPIHNEKTPSFAVSEIKGTYYCFGCHAHGDVISFVQEMEHCSFIEAIKLLGDRVGIKMPEVTAKNPKTEAIKHKKDRMYALMRDAAEHYFTNLRSDAGLPAREYAIQRGLSTGILRAFGIGYSTGYTALTDYLTSKGYTDEEMLEAGVAESKGNRIYDALFGRLIVPILNNANKIIAFGGRYIGSTDFAKYKNTKETLIFEKRKELFGLHMLKKVKIEQGFSNVIIVEGYMDVISLYQAGVKNVCASMGTALTQEQAKTLKYYSNNIYLCYDGDKAGQKATYRGIDILRDAGLNVRVIKLPEELDPDDVIKKHGLNTFKQLIEEAMPPTEYKLLEISRQYSLTNPEEQGKFAVEAIKILGELATIVEREAYLPLISKMCNVSVDALKRELYNNANETISAGYKESEKIPKFIIQNKKDPLVEKYYKAARFVLLMIYTEPKFSINLPDLSTFFKDAEHSVIFDNARVLLSQNIELNREYLKDFENNMEAIKIYDSNEDKIVVNKDKMFADCVQDLELSSLQIHLKDLQEQESKCKNNEEHSALLIKILNINNRIQELKKKNAGGINGKY